MTFPGQAKSTLEMAIHLGTVLTAITVLHRIINIRFHIARTPAVISAGLGRH